MGSANQILKNFFSKSQFLGSFKSIKEIESYNSNSEYCFIGRSNVGKSSIINSITNNRFLAKISKTPGRTQSINIFSLENDFFIVDLPGYGYAKVSKVLRLQLNYLINAYIKHRYNLNHIFVLVDTKIGIKNSDIDIFDLLHNCNRSFSIVYTKIDKSNKSYINKLNYSTPTLMKNYPNSFSQIFFTSSKTKEGILDVQKEIYQLSQKNEI